MLPMNEFENLDSAERQDYLFVKATANIKNLFAGYGTN